MRILIYGAGVLGSLYAARLKEAGNDVVLLARGRRLAELRAHDTVLVDEATGRQSVTRVDLTERLDPADAYDLAVVVMRKNQVADILPAVAANNVIPTVLFMVNNAAGPAAWVDALGRERVVLGFPGAGGAREGHVVRYLVTSRQMQTTTFGELDGQVSPRLQAIAEAFSMAGFPVAISPNMDAWQRTHVALVVPVANALLIKGGDNYALAKSPDTLRLMVQSVREGFRCLQELGIAITPFKTRLIAAIPMPILIPLLRLAFGTRRAELVMARHTRNATDEIKELSDELMALAQASGMATPALERLHSAVWEQTLPRYRAHRSRRGSGRSRKSRACLPPQPARGRPGPRPCGQPGEPSSPRSVSGAPEWLPS